MFSVIFRFQKSFGIVSIWDGKNKHAHMFCKMWSDFQLKKKSKQKIKATKNLATVYLVLPG